MSTSTPHPARAAYEKWAPYLFLLLTLTAVVGVWIGTVAALENGRQNAANAAENKARDEQTSALLDCFDDYAAAQSYSSAAVRAAAEDRDAAQGERDRALQQLVTLIVRNATNPPTDLEAARKEFIGRAVELRDSSRELDKAVAELMQAREENPIPKPPSQFCAVTP